VKADVADQNIYNMPEEMDVEALKASIKEAEKEVDLAERVVKNKKLHLQSLQKQLQDSLISRIGGLKLGSKVEQVKKAADSPKDEAARKAEVRRRWRVLGMKIKFGLGTQALAVKKRNLKDAASFIDKESEVAGSDLRFLYIS
jgi:hypothetical protein